jgi:hypothetical protein
MPSIEQGKGFSKALRSKLAVPPGAAETDRGKTS